MVETIRYLGKDIGVINENRVFVTRRNENHIFFKYRGLGLSEGVIRQLRQRGVQRVVFLFNYFKRDVQRLEVNIDQFNDAQQWNDGGDRQRVIPISEMGQETLVSITRER